MKEVPGKWSTTKAKLKQKFAVLTKKELVFTEGKKDGMFERLKIKFGKTKEELQKITAAL